MATTTGAHVRYWDGSAWVGATRVWDGARWVLVKTSLTIENPGNALPTALPFVLKSQEA